MRKDGRRLENVTFHFFFLVPRSFPTQSHTKQSSLRAQRWETATRRSMFLTKCSSTTSPSMSMHTIQVFVNIECIFLIRPIFFIGSSTSSAFSKCSSTASPSMSTHTTQDFFQFLLGAFFSLARVCPIFDKALHASAWSALSKCSFLFFFVEMSISSITSPSMSTHTNTVCVFWMFFSIRARFLVGEHCSVGGAISSCKRQAALDVLHEMLEVHIFKMYYTKSFFWATSFFVRHFFFATRNPWVAHLRRFWDVQIKFSFLGALFFCLWGVFSYESLQ